MVKVKNKISRNRVIYLMLAVFLLNFLSPIQGILDAGRMPNAVELARALVVGVLQVVTLGYALLERGEAKPSEPPG